MAPLCDGAVRADFDEGHVVVASAFQVMNSIVPLLYFPDRVFVRFRRSIPASLRPTCGRSGLREPLSLSSSGMVGNSPWGRSSHSASSPRRRSRTCARCLPGMVQESVNFLLRVDFIPRSVLPPKVVVERP